MRSVLARPLSIAFVASSAAAAVLACAACSSDPPPAPVPPPRPPPPPVAVVPPVPSLTLAQTGIDPAWMDTSVDPCQDYYAYACGGFVKTAEIPADRASWGATEGIQKSNLELLHSVLETARTEPGADPGRKKLGDYYDACMNEDAVDKAGLAPLDPLFASIAKVKDVRSLAAAVLDLHANAIQPLFRIDPNQDLKDATQVVAALDQSGLGLPDRDYYLSSDKEMTDTVAFYQDHVERMLALAGASEKEARVQAAEVVRVERALARIEQDKVLRRDPYKTYNPVDRSELKTIAPSFPWEAYFMALGIPAAHEVILSDKAYFRDLDALLHAEKPAAWRSYLRFRTLAAWSHVLPKPFVDESFRLRQKLLGAKELEPRWKRCVKDVDESLGELLGQAYVSAKFAGDSKERATEVVGWIQDAMRDDLRLLPWMDEPTRSAALSKLSAMHRKVGYPDVWREYGFKVTRDSYASDAQAAERFEQQRQLAKIGRPVDRGEWLMTPPTVNAYYEPPMNEIAIPAGQLQPPFFSKDFYPPVNIGDIGANTVGHEITHGFDDEGSKFDGNGNLRDWWSDASKKKFEAKASCVVDQYSRFEAVPGVKLNGALGAGENIADIGGVKLGLGALAAWKKAHPEAERKVDGYTDEKLFFLGYAQGWCSKERPELLATMARSNEHSPPRFRVNGPMIDTPAFAATYQCAAGTPMNDGKACEVW